MSLKKMVPVYNGRYSGCRTIEQCDMLEAIITADAGGKLPKFAVSLMDKLYDCDYEAVEKNLPFKKRQGKLRADQALGVAFMGVSKRCILGDSVGMGKTAEVSGYVNSLGVNVLYLTNKDLVLQTVHELERFTGVYCDRLFSALASDTTPYFALSRHNSLVCTHELLRGGDLIDFLERHDNPWGLLVVDESSKFGNGKTQISEGLKAVTGYFDRIVFLNATPFEKHLDTFYTQLNLLDTSGVPTKTDFDRRYVVDNFFNNAHTYQSNKYKHEDEFRYAVGYEYFARSRKKEGAVMEGCTRQLLLCSLTDRQKSLLTETQIASMVYDCPNYLDDRIKFTESNVPKLRVLRELITEGSFKDAPSVLVYVPYKMAQSGINEHLQGLGISSAVLNGDTSKADRDRIIKSFQEGHIRVLLTNVKRGLNFGNCNHCVFYSYDPNPDKMVQFEGRIFRDFDIRDKNVSLICTKGNEYRRLKDSAVARATAGAKFENTDFSCIRDILSDIDSSKN